ncbi:hypothetical protein AgCh_032127 [Apium graveolens]
MGVNKDNDAYEEELIDYDEEDEKAPDSAAVFDKFLHGSTFEECYAAVAAVANRWPDLLDLPREAVEKRSLARYLDPAS